jgi:hypothetical protein
MLMELTWKTDLKETWLALRVPEFLGSLGLDFEKIFLNPLLSSQLSRSPYENFVWSIIPLQRLLPGVLHAAPIANVAVQMAPAVWEEWFLEENENHHHVLRNTTTPPHNFTENDRMLHWRSPERDTEHPETVLGVDWHYFNDKNQVPFFLR